jgi:hypothetical protein
MKFIAQLIVGLVLTGVGIILVTTRPEEEILFWEGRPLGILLGVLGLVYTIGAVWTREVP